MVFFFYKGFFLEGLFFVGVKFVEIFDFFNIYLYLKKIYVEVRIKKLESGVGIDWVIVEVFVIGSFFY